MVMTWDSKKDKITVAEVLELYSHLGIPHFQRGLVWGNDSVAALLESLFYDTPCGSFVLWDSGDNQNHGIPMPGGISADFRYLIVDGQQRIRSLRQAFQNEEAGEGDDQEDPVGEAEGQNEAKAWCINLTQHDKFRDILEPHNRVYPLFVYATRPEKANPRSPLRKNILPLDCLLNPGDAFDPIRHLSTRPERHDVDVTGLLPQLRSEVNGILQRTFFVTVKKDTPATMISLYNRINSSGKRVEVEERAFARLVAIYPPSWKHVATIFAEIHGRRGTQGHLVDDRLERDDILERQKENRFGFKLFIRTFIQVCNYHLDRSAGSQDLSFNVVHSDSFSRLVPEGNTANIEFLWKETQEVLVSVRDLLRGELFCDSLAFLPDTMSLVPVFHALIQYPALREQRYRPVLAWAALSLLLADRGKDKILDDVAMLRKDGGVAAGIVPKVLGNWDSAARHKLRATQTLEAASSIQNRYVLLLYGLLRRNNIRDFSYKNLTPTSKLWGQDAQLVCEASRPEKQHIAPFSRLVMVLKDEDAKRGSNHRFNNIGNLTYISSDLNCLDGLSDKPIDREHEPNSNLHAHYLADDESLGKAGSFYDALNLVLCGKEDAPQDTVDHRYESFCRARRNLITHGFVSWMDDLKRQAEAAMGTISQLEAAIPHCVDFKNLPVTLQIRSMNYPNHIEGALVAYVKDIESHHGLKKQRKPPVGKIELRLSAGGAVRLLLSSTEIKVLYWWDRMPAELKAPIDRAFGIVGGDGCIYRRDRGGSVTLDQLKQASSEAVKIDSTPPTPSEPSRTKWTREKYDNELKRVEPIDRRIRMQEVIALAEKHAGLFRSYDLGTGQLGRLSFYDVAKRRIISLLLDGRLEIIVDPAMKRFQSVQTLMKEYGSLEWDRPLLEAKMNYILLPTSLEQLSPNAFADLKRFLVEFSMLREE